MKVDKKTIAWLEFKDESFRRKINIMGWLIDNDSVFVPNPPRNMELLDLKEVFNHLKWRLDIGIRWKKFMKYEHTWADEWESFIDVEFNVDAIRLWLKLNHPYKG